MPRWRGVIEEFRSILPVTRNTPNITMGEGDTPLIQAYEFEEMLGIEYGFRGKIYFKLELKNPTGSFKDRGMVVAVAKAKEAGAESIMCASTGNTAASAAAYGAKAKLPVLVFIPMGNVATGKLAQIIAYGAEIVYINAKFDACQAIVEELGRRYPRIAVVNSTNPHRIQGQKTAALEICRELKKAPDYHFIPVGNAGNITAYWVGYKKWGELQETKLFSRASMIAGYLVPGLGNLVPLPRMMGWQAEGAAPFVRGYPIDNPETVASAIKIGNPASWRLAERAVSESGGRIDMVSDEEILGAQSLICKLQPEAACEPASAACVAGLIKPLSNERISQSRDVVVVCTLPGHFLKDPETPVRDIEVPKVGLDPNIEAVVDFLGL